MEVDIPKELFTPKHFKEEEMPGFGISVFTALIPVILIAFQAIVEIVAPKSSILPAAQFLGNPGVVLLVAVIVGIFTFGLNRGRKMPELMNSLTESISGIAAILLIIGGGRRRCV